MGLRKHVYRHRLPGCGKLISTAVFCGALGWLPARAAEHSSVVFALGDAAALLAALAAIGGVVWALRERQQRIQLRTEARFQTRNLTARLDDLDAIIETASDAHLVFDGGELVRAGGRFLMTSEVNKDSVDQFTELLEPVHTEELKQQITRLQLDGEKFILMATRKLDGASVQIEGRTAGPYALVQMHGSQHGSGDTSAGQLLSLTGAEIGFEAMLDAAQFPAWRRDAEQALTWVNTAYARAVDLAEPAQVVEQDISLSVTTESGAAGEPRVLKLHAAQVLKDAARHSFKTFIVAGGLRKAFEIIEFPIGEGTAGFALDITAAQDARTDLERHVRAHAETLDGLSSAIAIFGPEKHLRFYNGSFASQWHLDPVWLDTGPSNNEVIEALRERRLLPEQADFQAWKKERDALFTSLMESQEEVWHLPDGRMLHVITRPHPFGGLMFIYEDVTDQLTLERSYKALTGTHRTTIDSLSEGVAVFSSDGQLTLYNPAFVSIWDLPNDRLESGPHIKDVADWCGEKDSKGGVWGTLLDHVTSLGATMNKFDTRVEIKKGMVIDCAASTLPDGASLLTFADVTDTDGIERALRDKNEALETADRLKAEFISHISYELRTPLNAIMGFSEILQQQMFGPLNDKQTGHVTDILTSSHALLGLINNILDLATLEAGQFDLVIDHLDVNPLIEGVAALFHQRAEDKGIKLNINIAEDLPAVMGDETRLKQALFHLMSNAINFTDKGGDIVIGALKSGRSLALFVEDTGRGISKDHQATMFQEFSVRREGTQRGMLSGAGLGLSLVRRIVDLHGGQIKVRSKLGKGTRMALLLKPARKPRKSVGKKAPKSSSDDG